MAGVEVNVSFDLPFRYRSHDFMSFRSHCAIQRSLSLLIFAGTATLLISCGKPDSKPEPGSESVQGLNAATNSFFANTSFSNAGLILSNSDGPLEPDIDRATEHLSKGNALLSERKVNEAIAEFHLAAKFNPEDEDTFYNLGFAYSRAGNRELAKENYRKALEIFPDYVEAHNNLGNILIAEGDFTKGIEHLQHAVGLDKENASAQNNLGNAYARQGKVANSLVHFQTALELKPDYAEAHFNLANACLILGRADQAVEEFTRLLKLHPGFPRAQEQLQKAKAIQASNRPGKQ